MCTYEKHLDSSTFNLDKIDVSLLDGHLYLGKK